MEDLVESILDYIRTDYTDYAIMINGEWGSGKTYFWNNKIRKKIDSMKFNGKQYKTIYMSLYGISNLEEISKKIFIETTQLMDKNLKKYMNQHEEAVIPEYAKSGLDMANLFGISNNDGKIDYEEFFSTDDKILCFDDLERANVDVIDILGYINNFVEHDHIKTIIICNEKELSTKIKSSNLEMKTFIATYILDKEGELQNTDKPMVEKIKDQIESVFDKANEYERIKEKLIGETFEYVPKFDYIVNGILIRYEDDRDLVRFLRENTNLIISTFNKSGTRNLRILKHSLKDFQKIYQIVTQKYPNISNKIVQTMLIFTIAVSFEIKSGKVTKDKFLEIKNNEEYKSILVSSRVLMDNKQFYIKEFDNNYYYNFKTDYRFFKFIEYYVRTRIFDMKLFKKDMDEIQNSGESKTIPAYRRLLTEEYWKIPDEEFLKVINEIIKEINEGEINLVDLVKIYTYFSYFSNKGLIPYEIETLKKIFKNGMELAVQKSNYCENIEEELDKIGINKDFKDVKDMLNVFYTLNEKIKEKKYKQIAEEIMKCIPMKMESFYERFDKECMNVPIFKYQEPRIIFQRLLYSSNEDLIIIRDKLIKRAKIYKEKLISEKENMKKIKEIIDEYIKDKSTSIKTVMLEKFSSGISEIIKIYDE
ncbi:MAG: hypothetical protein BHV99_00265 [Clostridium sp. 26_21]|nr:MAG: hypothetical protein BHV99_00265 [Clostridium sp. 26_21]